MTPAALTPGALDEIGFNLAEAFGSGHRWMPIPLDDVRALIASARELEAVRDRVTTIADEATGPHPVQSIEESLTCIERGFVSYRRTSELWRAERDAALADLAKAREELAFARDSYMADRCEADGIRAERDELRERVNSLNRMVRDDYNEVKALRTQLAALDARAADALLAEAIIDDDVASEAQMLARLTWHDRVRRYLDNAPAAPAKACENPMCVAALDCVGHDAAPSPLAAQLAEAVAHLDRLYGLVLAWSVDGRSYPAAVVEREAVKYCYDALEPFLERIDKGGR